ncbi:MAG TPA: dTMP kinase [Deltaproteobacteria bacterium]|nr:dTMP kinase [Deltaproteobacteria bacterium]
MSRGCFITFEGIEGSGKSTQIGLLEEHLAARGAQVVRLREPGGTPIGDRVRSILLDPSSASMCAETEMFLFAASRAQLIRERIGPALDAGQVVLCDRFLHSSLAYQGMARGLGRDLVAQVNSPAVAGELPDRVVLMDLPPEQALERARGRAELDRIEREDLGFHQAVRQGFQDEAESERDRFLIIDATADPETIHHHVLAGLQPLFGRLQVVDGSTEKPS